MGPDRAEHWDGRYAAGDTDLSWYQEHARTSVELMDAVGRTPDTVVERCREIRHTPGGAAQPFTWLAGTLR